MTHFLRAAAVRPHILAALALSCSDAWAANVAEAPTARDRVEVVAARAWLRDVLVEASPTHNWVERGEAFAVIQRSPVKEWLKIRARNGAGRFAIRWMRCSDSRPLPIATR